jgi:hypothetical protein
MGKPSFRQTLMIWRRLFHYSLSFLLLPVACAKPSNEVQLLTEQLNIPERGQVTAFVLKVQTNRFSFMPPPEWRATCEAAESKIVLLPKDLSASIIICVRSNANSTDKPLEVKMLREKLARRFPEATLIADFPCYCNSLQGHAFHLERTTANGVKIPSCIAFFGIIGWEIDFELTTTNKYYKKRFQSFLNLMGSFQVKSSVMHSKKQESHN